MDSIDRECTPLKHKFDACFTRWYSEKFLQGDKTNDCEQAFKEYQACLRRALKEKGLTKMISEARPTIGSAFADNDSDERP
ncbi:Mitochondrial distribution and morphology protein 35 [Coemansia spiralis]|nr:Mitochondrial distribution and morphology protein 35 [Coemansia spiralis]